MKIVISIIFVWRNRETHRYFHISVLDGLLYGNVKFLTLIISINYPAASWYLSIRGQVVVEVKYIGEPNMIMYVV